MSIKKGRFYLTFKSSLIAFFLIKFFVNYSQPFCNLTATLHPPLLMHLLYDFVCFLKINMLHLCKLDIGFTENTRFLPVFPLFFT